MRRRRGALMFDAAELIDIVPDFYRQPHGYDEFGERALWRVVLWDAVDLVARAVREQHTHGRILIAPNAKSASGRTLRNIEAAQDWINAHGSCVQSFEWICDVVGIDAGALRAVIFDPLVDMPGVNVDGMKGQRGGRKNRKRI